MLRFALNGGGRIGRLILRGSLRRDRLVPVAVNDRFDAATLALGLRRDTLRGPWPGDAPQARGDHVRLGGSEVRVLTEPDPSACPWSELEVDVVVEATGRFITRNGAEGHLGAGARRVVVTAPLAGDDRPDAMVVPGVNDGDLQPGSRVLSLASCTTNCAAPILVVLHEKWGVLSTHLCTVHAYTSDQLLLDGSHEDPRRARAAALNVIPTTTGAVRALQEILPWTQGRIEGVSYRVPVGGGSLLEVVCLLEGRPRRAGEVVEALRDAAGDGRVLRVTEEPLVSSDVLGCEASALVDAPLVSVLEGGHVKVVAWYDNEAAYAARVLDVLEGLAERDL